MSESTIVRWLWAVCLGWGLATFSVAYHAVTGAEYARAASEARAVAASWDGTNVTRSPQRLLMAAGTLQAVQSVMERFTSEHVGARLAREDRTLLFSGGIHRYVAIPIKDADEWDVIGAVVLRTWWMDGLLPLVGVAVLASVIATLVARRAVSHLFRAREVRAGDARKFIPVEAFSVLAGGMAATMIVVRLRLDFAAEVLRTTTIDRFDPYALPLPSVALVGAALLIVLVLAGLVLTGAMWVAAGRGDATVRRESVAAWAFLAPSAAHLMLFTIIPLGFTLYLATHRWDLLATDRPFIGLGNFRELASDANFWHAMRNTAMYSLYVPVSMVLALGAAVVLNQPLRGVRLLRTIVFLPTIVSYVAIAMVWQWLYNNESGMINALLRVAGFSGLDWLGDPRVALIAVMIVSAWVHLGYQMIVFLAGLQGIPAHLYEAAQLEGAGAWARFRDITVPLLRPVSLYLLVTGIVWSFQVFSLVYVMTEGGPVRATDVAVYHIYQEAFEFRRMGYASAMSTVLFVVLVVLTALQWRLLNRRIEYAA